MSINLQALETVLSSLQEIGQGEVTFSFQNIPITLRTLLPEEDAEVQSFAALAITDNPESVASVQTQQYIERFKIAVISHALIYMGDQDFRNIDLVETGEKLPNGNSVKIPKLKALRDIITKKWSGPLRTAVFIKYKELLDRTDIEAENKVNFDPVDLDAEILRLQNRIVELTEEKERRLTSIRSGLSAEVAEIAKLGNQQLEVSLETDSPDLPEAEEEEEDFTPPVAAPAPAPTARPSPEATVTAPLPRTRQPITPTTAAPPAALKQPRTQGQEQPKRASSPQDFDLEEPLTSEMVDQENTRLLLERVRRGQTLGEPVQAARNRPPQIQTPNAVDEPRQEASFLGQTTEGVPVYAMPSSELQPKNTSSAPQKQVVLDPTGSNARNPRFRPAR